MIICKNYKLQKILYLGTETYMLKYLLTCLLIFFITCTQAQVPEYWGEVICISGNCKNGKGRVRLSARDNIEIESLFSKRRQHGIAKVYSYDGVLIYEGYLRNYTPHGRGKRFELDKNGKYIVVQDGRFENNLLVEGITRDKNGKVLTNGYYDSNGRPIIKR